MVTEQERGRIGIKILESRLGVREVASLLDYQPATIESFAERDSQRRIAQSKLDFIDELAYNNPNIRASFSREVRFRDRNNTQVISNTFQDDLDDSDNELNRKFTDSDSIRVINEENIPYESSNIRTLIRNDNNQIIDAFNTRVRRQQFGITREVRPQPTIIGRIFNTIRRLFRR